MKIRNLFIRKHSNFVKIAFHPAILLVLYFAVTNASGLAPFLIHNNLEQRYHQEIKQLADQQTETSDCDNDSFIKEYWFTQKYDQFNSTDTRTYGQRYFVNLKFYDNTTNNTQPVVFLQIGGETEMAKRWVCFENYTYMTLAKQNGAIVVMLEHRFFGKNKNMPNLSTTNLQYLTTEQALADIAAFIPAFSNNYSLVNPRWVAFGGSYPGSLAAWLRIKYPDLTVGSVASSAPLWPKVNFWEYSDVMEKTINDTSTDCYKNLGLAFQQLKKMTLTETGRANLTAWFHIDPPMIAEPDDITNFYSFVFKIFQVLIQYTYDARNDATLNGLNISQACIIMNTATAVNDTSISHVKRLAYLNDWYKQLETGIKESNISISYKKSLENMLNVSLLGPQASMRGWMWLSCNEFGWFQTTDKGNSLFGDIISVGSYNKLCIDMFGPPINSSYIERQVAKAQKTFGSPVDYNATNVILINGEFDPWSALRVKVSIPDQHQIAIVTPGAAHCSDMYPPYNTEPKRLIETRKRVMEEVNYYLRTSLVQNKPTAENYTNGAQGFKFKMTTIMALFSLLALLY